MEFNRHICVYIFHNFRRALWELHTPSEMIAYQWDREFNRGSIADHSC